VNWRGRSGLIPSGAGRRHSAHDLAAGIHDASTTRRIMTEKKAIAVVGATGAQGGDWCRRS